MRFPERRREAPAAAAGRPSRRLTWQHVMRRRSRSSCGRARSCCARDHTLGTRARAAGQGPRRQRRSSRRPAAACALTYAQAAKRVDRWAGGIAARHRARRRRGRGRRRTATSSSCCAWPRRAPGAIPVPVNPQMRPDEIAHVVADSGAALVMRGRGRGRRRRAARRRRCRPSPATSPRSSTRRARPASRRASSSPPGAGRAARPPAWRWPAGCAATRRCSRLPVAHIMGFSTAARPGVRRHARVLPADVPTRSRCSTRSRQRRATMFIGVPAMYRMMLEAGAEHRDLTSVRRVGIGRRRHARRPGRAVQADGRHARRCRSSDRSARRCSSRATAWSRSAAGWRPRSSPPMLDVGLGESLGFPLPGYRFRVVDDDGAEVAHRRRSASCWCKGPGVLKGYWGDAEATAATAHRRRVAAHRRPGPQGPARHGRVRRPPEGRDQARRLLGLRGRGRAGARGAPRRARGRGRRPARRAAGRGPGRRGAPGRRHRR